MPNWTSIKCTNCASIFLKQLKAAAVTKRFLQSGNTHSLLQNHHFGTYTTVKHALLVVFQTTPLKWLKITQEMIPTWIKTYPSTKDNRNPIKTGTGTSETEENLL